MVGWTLHCSFQFQAQERSCMVSGVHGWLCVQLTRLCSPNQVPMEKRIEVYRPLKAWECTHMPLFTISKFFFSRNNNSRCPSHSFSLKTNHSILLESGYKKPAVYVMCVDSSWQETGSSNRFTYLALQSSLFATVQTGRKLVSIPVYSAVQ